MFKRLHMAPPKGVIRIKIFIAATNMAPLWGFDAVVHVRTNHHHYYYPFKIIVTFSPGALSYDEGELLLQPAVPGAKRPTRPKPRNAHRMCKPGGKGFSKKAGKYF